ncbi:hypothetical protein SLNWT_4710 [Streptomyces albus]|uniref:Uncharacterized protein n=1 Tax=Streptomyces albus (strain ATCC 21838 / DSM 41398 / FERM P-419 / JCM 4703 / NBRC 107858) TaxID=1081613 RepID=A0A0B5F2G2_STRA4|nr:hypothetical protein SLNWT_4710 [Streptomyces albus]AOU79393.1 hypothetical protein SLNHY_4702 [Streptomyces albus]AYN35120.1 hypothetical protein DUI70_4622 [Streptomyces albus]
MPLRPERQAREVSVHKGSPPGSGRSKAAGCRAVGASGGVRLTPRRWSGGRCGRVAGARGGAVRLPLM